MQLLGGAFGGGLSGAPILNEAHIDYTHSTTSATGTDITIPFTIVDYRRVAVYYKVLNYNTTGNAQGVISSGLSFGDNVTSNPDFGTSNGGESANELSVARANVWANGNTNTVRFMSTQKLGTYNGNVRVIAHVIEYDVSVVSDEIIEWKGTSTTPVSKTITTPITNLDKTIICVANNNDYGMSRFIVPWQYHSTEVLEVMSGSGYNDDGYNVQADIFLNSSSQITASREWNIAGYYTTIRALIREFSW